MNINPIKTQRDYNNALARIEDLMEAEFNTPEGDELDVLTTLVENYEGKAFPIEVLDPIEFLKNAMEFRGHSPADLSKLLNSRSRASELLAKKRALSIGHIRIINKAWNIPAEPLLQEYELQT
ncbi:MAG TPA: hypothetical protein DCM64_09970 [Gammaproteobacteria bacterium]|jgi:HTH-type transcriptional regulator/antitoxin HigA|nr:hypothetical protein [Gammaproteobacteria bacterium]MDP6732908.1 hypothetical protein [Gammaproteobacteria bacterium]HAJ76768.1 hypothetical protein [Gammaproteobacteria bacterium]|tara:strand:+ start:1924 stop:2292 length:369 start_codon:yes stop_codon:yes gene_type:complete